MASERKEQLAYSEQMAAMLDEDKRRQKAAKILAVLRHALGRDDLSGLRAVDVGCSAGFIADELAGRRRHHARCRHRRAGAGAGQGAFRAPGHLPLRAGGGHAVRGRQRRRRGPQPHLRARRRPGRGAAPRSTGSCPRTACVYLGLANRLGVVEPHYRLPFLSWLPHGPLADRYVRAFGRADHYYERFRTRPGLRRLVAAFDTWDYTLPVLTDPAGFNGGDVVPGAVARVPTGAVGAAAARADLHLGGLPDAAHPAGPPLATGPRRV